GTAAAATAPAAVPATMPDREARALPERPEPMAGRLWLFPADPAAAGGVVVAAAAAAAVAVVGAGGGGAGVVVRGGGGGEAGSGGSGGRGSGGAGGTVKLDGTDLDAYGASVNTSGGAGASTGGNGRLLLVSNTGEGNPGSGTILPKGTVTGSTTTPSFAGPN